MSNSPNPSSLTYETNPFEQSFANKIQNGGVPGAIPGPALTPGAATLNPVPQSRPDQRPEQGGQPNFLVSEPSQLYPPYNYFNLASPIPIMHPRMGPQTPGLYANQLTAEQLVAPGPMGAKPLPSPGLPVQPQHYPQMQMQNPGLMTSMAEYYPQGFPDNQRLVLRSPQPQPLQNIPENIPSSNIPLPRGSSTQEAANVSTARAAEGPQPHQQQHRLPSTTTRTTRNSNDPVPIVPNETTRRSVDLQSRRTSASNASNSQSNSAQHSRAQSRQHSQPVTEDAAANGLFMLSKDAEDKLKAEERQSTPANPDSVSTSEHADSPKYPAANETSEERRKANLERNRLAALKSRRRKKQWVNELQEKLDFYFKISQNFELTIGELRAENDQLKQFIMNYHELALLPPNVMEIMSKPPPPPINISQPPNMHKRPKTE